MAGPLARSSQQPNNIRARKPGKGEHTIQALNLAGRPPRWSHALPTARGPVRRKNLDAAPARRPQRRGSLSYQPLSDHSTAADHQTRQGFYSQAHLPIRRLRSRLPPPRRRGAALPLGPR